MTPTVYHFVGARINLAIGDRQGLDRRDRATARDSTGLRASCWGERRWRLDLRNRAVTSKLRF
ncbi:hypothetical protein [Microcoleus sp. herbarium12]|uniref:hypothetical protein n=1 Tax=Microcoleus sp. herbarium12 TaxID=3055437 RepID=UPI002FD0EA64